MTEASVGVAVRVVSTGGGAVDACDHQAGQGPYEADGEHEHGGDEVPGEQEDDRDKVEGGEQ